MVHHLAHSPSTRTIWCIELCSIQSADGLAHLRRHLCHCLYGSAALGCAHWTSVLELANRIAEIRDGCGCTHACLLRNAHTLNRFGYRCGNPQSDGIYLPNQVNWKFLQQEILVVGSRHNIAEIRRRNGMPEFQTTLNLSRSRVARDVQFTTAFTPSSSSSSMG